MLAYAGFCTLWLPLSFWVIPRHALKLGQVHADDLPSRKGFRVYGDEGQDLIEGLDLVVREISIRLSEHADMIINP